MKVPLLFRLAFFTLVSVAAADGPEWARGWIVASVIIPADGDLKDAAVDFQMPDGQPVTLTPGTQTKDGVVLSSVVWEGTPVRAKVRLSHGGTSAELYADAALVAKSKTQKKAPGLVEIESRFIEVPEALAPTLKDPSGNRLFPPAAKGAPPAPVGGVLKKGEEQAFLAKLQKMKGVDLLSAPRVTTKSGQRAVIEIIREFIYAVEWEPDTVIKGGWVPTAFETRNVGVTLEVVPTVAADDTIDLRLVPQVVEHLGTVDLETGKPVKPDSAGRRLRPVFSTRKNTTDVSVVSGTSVILGGIAETEDIKPFKPKTPGRRLIVIVTARRMVAE